MELKLGRSTTIKKTRKRPCGTENYTIMEPSPLVTTLQFKLPGRVGKKIIRSWSQSLVTTLQLNYTSWEAVHIPRLLYQSVKNGQQK